MPVVGGEVIRCSLRQRGPNGQDIVNVYHYLVAAISPISEEDVLADVATAMGNTYALLNQEITNLQDPVDLKIDVVDYLGGQYTITRNVGTVGWGGPYNPQNSADVYAAGVAALLLLRTLVGKVFGRKFIGVWTETGVNNQMIAGQNAPQNLVAFAASLLAGISTANGEYFLGVMSNRLFDFAMVHEIDVATEIGYQRRRSIRSGS